MNSTLCGSQLLFLDRDMYSTRVRAGGQRGDQIGEVGIHELDPRPDIGSQDAPRALGGHTRSPGRSTSRTSPRALGEDKASLTFTYTN